VRTTDGSQHDRAEPRGALRDGSIFAVLNLHHELGPTAALDTVRRQARRAIDLGFEGVGLSEHHAGFPGYLPAPLLAGATLLADLPRGFYAALPVILPLRQAPLVVEEAAWLDAIFPGRVVLGLAAGYQEEDFEPFGVPFAERFPRFRRQFEEVAIALRGESAVEGLRRDPALRQAAGRVGLVMATRGRRNARLAARLGAAVTPTQLTVEGYRDLFGVYRAAGGRAARVVQRWVFLGDPPADAIEALNASVRAAPGDHSWWDDGARIVPLSDHSPRRLAERLLDWLRASDGTALCVRFHLGPLASDVVGEQIERFGADVLPLVRRGLDDLVAEIARREAPVR
jgi:alkanesulfonate monooxygenase SsuD/methylene tetrahydromethanopterin reductase-like flavin-dependent oxidoreductase (luciferase family)